MPRDAAGVSRIGMFEQIVTPTGDTFSPTGGTGTRVNLATPSGKKITVSSCDRSPRLVQYANDVANGPNPYGATPVPGVLAEADD